MLDTEGYPFTYKSSLNKRIDRITAMDLTIPLMVGFTVDGVYALMGAKFCVTVSDNRRRLWRPLLWRL